MKEIVNSLGRKKKLFGCPPPPAPNFWKLEKVFTVQKYTTPNFQNSKKSCFFSLRISIFWKYFLICCFQLVYILTLVVNLSKDIFGKVVLFAPLLGEIEAIIPCSFDSGLKKKIRPPTPSQKKLWRTTKQLFFLGLISFVHVISNVSLFRKKKTSLGNKSISKLSAQTFLSNLGLGTCH